MKSKAKRPTKAEQARMARLKEMPCMACHQLSIVPELEKVWSTFFGSVFGSVCGPTEVQHLIRGNKRRGHMATIPLGAWHHRGIPQEGFSADDMKLIWGPSLARSSKAFHAAFGSDDELLARTNKLLEST